jgi:hypothetical protein
MKQQIITGARARLTIEGRAVGYATDVSCSEEVQYEPIRVLDNLHTMEFVPVGYDISFSASRVRLFGDSIRGGTGAINSGLRIFASHGQNSATHLQNILNLNNMSAIIEDTFSAATFVTIQGVQVTRHNWTVSARGVVGEDIEFVGIRMLDETESP